MKALPEKLPFTPDQIFVDREQELDAVLKKARRIAGDLPVERRVVIFHGQRGAGKTWLLRKLEQSLPDHATPHFVDLGKEEQVIKNKDQIPKQRPLVLLLDNLSEVREADLGTLLDRVMSPLVQEDKVLIVLAERGRPVYLAAPEFREKSEEFHLEPFETTDVQKQVESQFPGKEVDLNQVASLGGGYPWSTHILAQLFPDAVVALKHCADLLLQDVNERLRPFFEALCVLRAFDETRMPSLLRVYSREFAEQTWDYAARRQVRDDLVATTLASWNADARGYVLDKPLRLVLEATLRERDFELWTRLHCSALGLYVKWAEQYEQSREWWAREAQHHVARLKDAGLDPADCPNSEKVNLQLLSLLLQKRGKGSVEKSGQEGPQETATAQVFLSYTRKDEKQVEKLYQDLSDTRLKPWMDRRDIYPGEDWDMSIQRAIRQSDFFLACLSAHSVSKRGYLQKEIKAALDIWEEKLESDIYLIPVRLEACEVPERLRKFQWVNLFDENGWARLVKAIQEGIKRREKSQEEERDVD